MEKINTVVDFGDSHPGSVSCFAKIHYGVKQFSESDKGKDILVIIIIILVGLASFGLGRLSKNDSNTGIKIKYNEQGANIINSLQSLSNEKEEIKKLPLATNINQNKFFASNRGSKYYTLGCSGGKNIKQENRMYFATSEDAERAGYELSSMCK